MKKLLSIENMYDMLMTITKKEILNRDLFKAICRDFSEKNLNQSTVELVFSQKKGINELSNVELMTFTNATKIELNKQNLELEYDKTLKMEDSFDYIDIDLFFSDEDIRAWEKYKYESKKIDKFEVKYFRRIDGFRYTGVLSYKELTLMLQNNIIIDNAETQRKSNVRMLGTRDNFIQEINTNQKNIDDMAGKILEGKFCPTEILINVPLINLQKTPQVHFSNYDEDGVMGTLRITPNPDTNSPTETDLNLIDGRHRAYAIKQAYERKLKETGEELQGSITCQVFLRSIADAKNIVNQVFIRSDDDSQWQASLKRSAFNDFTDAIVSNSIELKNTPEILDHCRAKNTMTYKLVLTSAVKSLNIDVANPSILTFAPEAMGKFIDSIIGSMNRNNMKLNYENSVNLCAGYVVLAWELRDYDMKKNDWDSLSLLIYKKIDTQLIRELKLNHKHYVMNSIVNYFKDIAQEVIANGQ